jgi:hypothetical protein
MKIIELHFIEDDSVLETTIYYNKIEQTQQTRNNTIQKIRSSSFLG